MEKNAALLLDKDLGFKAPLGLICVKSSIEGDGSGLGFILSLHLLLNLLNLDLSSVLHNL